VNPETIAALVDSVLDEFKNEFVVAAILQPQRGLDVWKVVLTRHQYEPQEPLTIAVDMHYDDTDEVIKTAIRNQIRDAIGSA
jgi:hypothetical protein